jgi:hypothetical protein
VNQQHATDEEPSKEEIL